MAAPASRAVALSRSINRPSITIGAVVLGIALGALHVPHVEDLRPAGEFYLALLQMFVLPFLMTTIPLAVRSAMTSGSGGREVRRLVLWVAFLVVAVCATTVLVGAATFYFFHVDEATIARIGAFVAQSSDRVDIEFALDPQHAVAAVPAAAFRAQDLLPTNIFVSLSGNDTMKVLIFMAIFGGAVVATAKPGGYSLFSALEHIQAACIRIFDWFSLVAPLGMVALIAPQIALMGPEIGAILGMFVWAFFATSILVTAAGIIGAAIGLRTSPRAVFAAFLRPMMLAVATRNSTLCIPLTLEVLKDDLGAAGRPCDLYVPVGLSMLRFGTIIYFILATQFMGALMGRPFGLLEFVTMSVLATVASFATLGVNGPAALPPLAGVLRPFGLSYELAVPLMVIFDPVANMVRTPINIALNAAIPAIASGRETKPISGCISSG
jgi:proton glutamate symport protein